MQPWRDAFVLSVAYLGLTTKPEQKEMLALYIHGRPGTLDAIALCASSRPALELLRGLGLTPRQARVLQLLWEGATNAEIALALTLSEHTVRHHIEEVYRRLGVRSRAAAANVAARALREAAPEELDGRSSDGAR